MVNNEHPRAVVVSNGAMFRWCGILAGLYALASLLASGLHEMVDRRHFK
jgi:hypothetical protein